MASNVFHEVASLPNLAAFGPKFTTPHSQLDMWNRKATCTKKFANPKKPLKFHLDTKHSHIFKDRLPFPKPSFLGVDLEKIRDVLRFELLRLHNGEVPDPLTFLVVTIPIC